MVEAWASGLTWKEIMMDCAMDEGDLARLLRRTIDLLAQVCMLLKTSSLLLTLFKEIYIARLHILGRPFAVNLHSVSRVSSLVCK